MNTLDKKELCVIIRNGSEKAKDFINTIYQQRRIIYYNKLQNISHVLIIVKGPSDFNRSDIQEALKAKKRNIPVYILYQRVFDKTWNFYEPLYNGNNLYFGINVTNYVTSLYKIKVQNKVISDVTPIHKEPLFINHIVNIKSIRQQLIIFNDYKRHTVDLILSNLDREIKENSH